MDEEARDALIGSIKKWEDIIWHGGEDRADENCPLCKLFYNHDCLNCPISEHTGNVLCENTPYEDWAEHQPVHFTHLYQTIHCDECRTLAVREFHFLIGLLTKDWEEREEE